MRLNYLIVAAALVIVLMQMDWSSLDRVMERMEGAAPSSSTERIISGRVKVVDGDTLRMESGKRIRLYGIDAPEGDQTCLDGKGERYRCGVRSAEALSRLIGRKGHVECTVRDIDQYQRMVAECRASTGTDLNREMVRTGWAVDYQQFSRGKFATVQREAQIEKKGIWEGSFMQPSLWRTSRP